MYAIYRISAPERNCVRVLYVVLSICIIIVAIVLVFPKFFKVIFGYRDDKDVQVISDCSFSVYFYQGFKVELSAGFVTHKPDYILFPEIKKFLRSPVPQ